MQRAALPVASYSHGMGLTQATQARRSLEPHGVIPHIWNIQKTCAFPSGLPQIGRKTFEHFDVGTGILLRHYAGYDVDRRSRGHSGSPFKD